MPGTEKSHGLANDDPVRRIENKVDKILVCLQGDIEDGSLGALGRLDRLEQSDQRRTWWVRAALGASITAVLGALWSSLWGKHP